MANQFREKQVPLMLFVSYSDNSFKEHLMGEIIWIQS